MKFLVLNRFRCSEEASIPMEKHSVKKRRKPAVTSSMLLYITVDRVDDGFDGGRL